MVDTITHSITKAGQSDRTDTDQSTDTQINFRKNLEQTPAKDDRPIAEKTGVKEIDQDSKDKGYQLKTFDEIKEQAGAMAAEKEAAAKPQELDAPDANNVTYAPITGIDALDQQSKDNGDTLISQEEWDQKRADAVQQQADKIAAKFAKDKSKDHDLGH